MGLKMQIKFQLEKGAYKPTKAHDTDAGFDLYATEDQKGSSSIIDTKVHILIPKGYVGLIFPRSSMSKRGFITPTGVIDAGYTGTVKVKLDYMGTDNETHYYAGERIAQLVIVKIPEIELVEGNVLEEETERGDGGFGSTGR